MKSCKPLAFFADRNAPIRAEPIHTQVILVAVQFLDSVDSERDGASVRFETFVDQGVHTDSQSVIWITRLLTWGKLGSYDQARDAQWLLLVYNVQPQGWP